MPSSFWCWFFFVKSILRTFILPPVPFFSVHKPRALCKHWISLLFYFCSFALQMHLDVFILISFVCCVTSFCSLYHCSLQPIYYTHVYIYARFCLLIETFRFVKCHDSLDDDEKEESIHIDCHSNHSLQLTHNSKIACHSNRMPIVWLYSNMPEAYLSLVIRLSANQITDLCIAIKATTENLTDKHVENGRQREIKKNCIIKSSSGIPPMGKAHRILFYHIRRKIHLTCHFLISVLRRQTNKPANFLHKCDLMPHSKS